MNTLKNNWLENMRIIWAITAKDVWEALRNKNVIALLASVVFIIVFYRGLPLLTRASEPPALLVYDAGDSALTAFLENSTALDLYTYPSEAKLKRYLANGDVPELGLVIPADFDRKLEAGQPLELQGYVLSWVSQEDAQELQSFYEAEIARLVGSPVTINMQNSAVYLEPDSGGLGVTMGLAMIFSVIMVGMTLIPHLMLEEKNTKTMEALLVSPASAGHVVVAKALTGIFYCLLTVGLALALSYALVVHWWLALLAIFCGSLFAVSLGLWLGTLIESRAQLTLWAWVLLMPLLLPLMLSLMEELLPDALVQVFRLIPSVVTFNLLRMSFAGSFPLDKVLLYPLWLLAWAGLVLLGEIWLLRRQADRAEKGTQESYPPQAAQSQVSAAQVEAPASPPLAAIDLAPESGYTGAKASILGAIGVVAAKDIRDALRNKIFISVMLGVAVMMLSTLLPPLLVNLRHQPSAVVYERERSTIVRGLGASDQLRLSLVDSLQEMETNVVWSPRLQLGLELPADFDQLAGSGEPIDLQAYVAHWADPAEAAKDAAFFETQLSQASWSTVRIHLSNQALYPQADDVGGQPFLIGLNLVVAMLAMGVALVPLLLIEEKEGHTLEALLVSPLSYGQLAFGKALAGSVYCLAAVAVFLLFNQRLIVHWPVAILAVLLGSALVVSIGVLLGTLFDNPSSMAMWGGLLLLLLLIPGLISLSAVQLPAPVSALINGMPTTAMTRLLWFSMAGQVPVASLLKNASIVLVATLLVSSLVIWTIRRADR